MNAPTFISKIQKAGFHLALRGDVLEVSPASSLTDEQRRFIRTHKPALVAELKAANDPPLKTVISRQAAQHVAQDSNTSGSHADTDSAEKSAEQGCTDSGEGPVQFRPPPGSTTNGDHALPWPLEHHQGELTPTRCRDCQHQRPTQHPVLIECGAGRRAPGACGMWWSLDQHPCTQFEEIAR